MFTFLLAPLFWLASGPTVLIVQVEITRPDDGGHVYLAICRGEEAFTTVKGCIERSVKVNGTLAEVRVEDIPHGEYAIKALHDLNGNKDMDFNMIGLPKEPYGFSNNVMGTFGPPSFGQAKFKVGEGRTVTRFRMRN